MGAMQRWVRLSAIAMMGAWASRAALAAEGGKPASFTLDGRTYSLTMPEKAVVDAAASQVTFRDLTKSQRLERSLIISLEPNEAGSAVDRMLPLAEGRTLAYQMTDNIDGGSGGPIAELKGRVAFGDIHLFVTCTDQDEWLRDAKWCVPLLESLKVAPGN